ncbi:hypothetical protein T07_14806 [Trichinella nelsoni]|uniref:Uncharacterized protein n=1 Tax=Trichinella nelsoni TaxID=6336 RepID=A0A0V0SJC0_9BILA|nr:hypothetical protein T07_14806 [Trichinella nelsoni]
MDENNISRYVAHFSISRLFIATQSGDKPPLWPVKFAQQTMFARWRPVGLFPQSVRKDFPT